MFIIICSCFMVGVVDGEKGTIAEIQREKDEKKWSGGMENHFLPSDTRASSMTIHL